MKANIRLEDTEELFDCISEDVLGVFDAYKRVSNIRMFLDLLLAKEINNDCVLKLLREASFLDAGFCNKTRREQAVKILHKHGITRCFSEKRKGRKRYLLIKPHIVANLLQDDACSKEAIESIGKKVNWKREEGTQGVRINFNYHPDLMKLGREAYQSWHLWAKAMVSHLKTF